MILTSPTRAERLVLGFVNQSVGLDPPAFRLWRTQEVYDLDKSNAGRALVLGFVNQSVGLDPGHHATEFFADFLDLVGRRSGGGLP